jgi:serine/threonine-protein kinase RsbW
MADPLLSFPATFPDFARAAAELRATLESRGIGSRPLYSAELVFEEIVSNVIRHGCSDRAQCTVEVHMRFEENAIVMTFEDDGPPFDPRSYALPALPRTLEEARHGGLGLLLVNKASQRIEYEWTGTRRNRVTVTIGLAETVTAATG